MTTYEQLLDRDPSWALLEGSMHFEENSAVHKTLRKITKRLDELGIAHCVVGGMAMFFHGYRRFTEDVDLLVTAESLEKIHRELEGRGYLPPFAGSKNLRDTEHRVKVEFLVTGRYPGDDKPKPVSFPDPVETTVVIDGVPYLTLPKLIELKIASGLSNTGRFFDLGDAQKLIQTLRLPEELADELNPFVQEKYRELWRGVHDNPEELA